MAKAKKKKSNDSDSDSTGRVGVHTVGALVEGKLQWAFREQPVNDYGIDAHVEPKTRERGPSGRLIALQIKSGTRYFKEKNDAGVIYRGKQTHLDYWERHFLPVILVLHNPESNQTLWQLVTKENVTRHKKGWHLVVPFENTIDERCRAAWDSISEGTPYQQRLRALVLAKPWMNIIEEGKRLFLEAEEWVNKSSGRGSMKLLAQDPDSGDEETVEEWPSLMFPGAVYQHLVPYLFPWADISIDDDFYERYDEDRHQSECANYSEGDFVGYTTDYRHWRKAQAEIRPYDYDASGEVAYFRFELEISSLGRAFLTLDRHLESGSVPVRPEKMMVGGRYATGLKAITDRYGLGRDRKG